MSRFIMPRQGVKGQNLNPADGAQLFFHNVGLTTDKATYSDEALTTANTNPVVSDATGLFGDIWVSGDYDVTLKDKNGVQLWGPEKITELDGSLYATLTQLAADSGSSLVGYDPVFTGSTARTVENRLQDVVSLMDFGATGDGVADDGPALQAAFDYLKVTPGELYVPANNYLITTRAKKGLVGCTISGAGYESAFISNVDEIDITGITAANPAVVTATAHGLLDGEQCYIKAVSGMVEINPSTTVIGLYKVANKTADTFELSGIDSTSFTAYTSGGTIHMPCISISDDVSALKMNTLKDFRITGVPGTSKESALLAVNKCLELETRRMYIDNSDNFGIINTGSQNVNNFNLTLRDNAVDGYYQAASIDGATNGTLHSFYGGTIKDNAQYGVSLRGGSSHTFDGVIFEQNASGGIKTFVDRLMVAKCSFEVNAGGHIIVGDLPTLDRASFAMIIQNEFGGASVEFDRYSSCNFENNILTSSCYVDWGADESNKLNYCQNNQMDISLMVRSLSRDALLIDGNHIGSDDDIFTALTVDSTDPSVMNVHAFTEAYTVSTNVVSFTDTHVGKEFTVIGSTGNVVFNHGTFLKTYTGANVTLLAGETAFFTIGNLSSSVPVAYLTSVI